MALAERTLTTRSPEQTQTVARAVARALRPGDVVALSGDLGAGKTVFVQGAAAALGVTQRVQSPSFVLVREYEGDVPIRHADVYRLNTIQELFDLGFEELFDPARILFVEWGDAVAIELPADRLEIEITGADADERLIVVRGVGAWAERLADVELTEVAS